MTNINTITMNIDGESKTFTSLQGTEFNTVSLKSIYDRIMGAVLPKILADIDTFDGIRTSACGRFTFESCVYEFRTNNANSEYGYDPYMQRAEISYKSKFVEIGKEEDARWEWTDLSCNRVEVEIAKTSTCDGDRTVYVVPQHCKWDNRATSDWIGLDAADNESTRDMDCNIHYGTKVEVHTDGDDPSKVEVDGTTYWADVCTYNEHRKARIRYNNKSYNFSTPAELDAAIETVAAKMIESEGLKLSIKRILDNEQQKFETRAANINDCDARRIVTAELNKSVMGGVVSLLEDAGFEKNERWHCEPAENGPYYYDIHMQKETDLGICTITASHFNETFDRQTKTHSHTAAFGISFGSNGGSANTKVDAHELLAKIEKAIAIAELAV